MEGGGPILTLYVAVAFFLVEPVELLIYLLSLISTDVLSPLGHGVLRLDVFRLSFISDRNELTIFTLLDESLLKHLLHLGMHLLSLTHL